MACCSRQLYFCWNWGRDLSQGLGRMRRAGMRAPFCWHRERNRANYKVSGTFHEENAQLLYLNWRGSGDCEARPALSPTL